MLKARLKPTGRLTTCRVCKHEFKIPEESKQAWFNLKNPCPSCKTLNCNLPPNEKNLQDLQSIWYDNGMLDNDLSNLYEALLKYAKSICLKLFQNLLRSEEDLEYFSHKAAWKTIEQYIKTKDSLENTFRVRVSFAAYLAFKLRESIFEKQEHTVAQESMDDISSLVEVFENNTMSRFDFSIECSHLKQTQEDIFFSEAGEEISNYFDSLNGELKTLVAVLNFLKFGENKSDLVFKNFGNEGRARFLYVIKQFKSELANKSFSTC